MKDKLLKALKFNILNPKESLMKNTKIIFLFLSMALMTNFSISAQTCCSASKEAAKEDNKLSISQMVSSKYELTNQDDVQYQLGDLIEGKTVVMNFVFTSCKTICPPMGANFAALKDKLGDRVNEDLVMLSISIDPATDTPQRLKAWQKEFGEHNDGIWNMLTGEKATVDKLLKDLEVFTPLIEEHAPIIIMGNADNDDWIRTNGLASPEILSEKVIQYLDKAAEAKRDINDLNYFTDLELENQHGEKFRFFSDLLKNKIVFINPFFAECPGSCPIMHTMMKDVQAHLGEKLGSSVVMLSITVDPVNDTPEILKDYAAKYDAKQGWHFLSGSVSNVNAIMKKIGKYVPEREAHDTVILIGNMKTKLWKKANGLANVTKIIEVLDSVINDDGSSE